MKKSSSILGKYSDGNYRKKGRSSVPAMVEYKQLYRGEIQAKTVTEKKELTLEERIAARTKPKTDPASEPKSEARVNIGGISYLRPRGSSRSVILPPRYMRRPRRIIPISPRSRLQCSPCLRHATG